MTSTASEIEQVVYDLLSNSDHISISGKLYKEGTRPINADSEDAVVTFLSGIDDQIQTGVVVVNIYVKDIDNGESEGVLVIDKERCSEIESQLRDFSDSVKRSNEFVFKRDKTIQTFKADEVKQHFVSLRLKFKKSTL